MELGRLLPTGSRGLLWQLLCTLEAPARRSRGLLWQQVVSLVQVGGCKVLEASGLLWQLVVPVVQAGAPVHVGGSC